MWLIFVLLLPVFLFYIILSVSLLYDGASVKAEKKNSPPFFQKKAEFFFLHRFSKKSRKKNIFFSAVFGKTVEKTNLNIFFCCFGKWKNGVEKKCCCFGKIGGEKKIKFFFCLHTCTIVLLSCKIHNKVGTPCSVKKYISVH